MTNRSRLYESLTFAAFVAVWVLTQFVGAPL